MSGSVVISYNRQDRQAAATLVQILEQTGLLVWWDARLAPGDTYSKVIDTQIRAAHAVVVLWSRQSIDSPWVINEASLAHDLGILVPVCIESCSPRLPFYSLHTLDLGWDAGGRRFRGVTDLVAALRFDRTAPRQGDACGVSARDLSAMPGGTLLLQVLRARTLDALRSEATRDPVAQWLYGTALLEGIGVTRDLEQARRYLEQSARAGVARALNSLGHMDLSGLSTPSDIARGLRYTRQAADAGVAIAQFSLGQTFRHGQCVPKDLVAAFGWYHRAAIGGSVHAMEALGWCYYTGEGTARSHAEAHHWFGLAAQAGHAGALRMVGALAADGALPGATDLDAARNFQAAFAAGEVEAANHLGDLYSDRRRTVFDPAQAIYWYSNYGQAGHPAGYVTAARFIMGAGGRHDGLDDPRMLMARAADLGDASAILSLAEMWEFGRYGDKNLAEARHAYQAVLGAPAANASQRAAAQSALTRLRRQS